jgi:hypothetical protein
LVDKVSISTNRIVTRNSSGTIKFDTNEKYFRTVTNGNYEVGGIARGPCVVGYGTNGNDQFFDFHQNKGFTTLLSRSGITITPYADFTMEFFVPSHAHSSGTYSASMSTTNIGYLDGGGVVVPRDALGNATFTTYAQTSNNAVTLYRRESPSDNWTSVYSDKLKYITASFTSASWGSSTYTRSYYYPDIYFPDDARYYRSTSMYYKVDIPVSWVQNFYYTANSQFAGNAFGTKPFWMHIPSVGRAPTELDIEVTP